MKTVYVKASGEFQYREEPLPTTEVGQVLAEVVYCGICGSDLTLARKEARDWTALGHAVSGRVREFGPGVTHVRAGDPVALNWDEIRGKNVRIRPMDDTPAHCRSAWHCCAAASSILIRSFPIPSRATNSPRPSPSRTATMMRR